MDSFVVGLACGLAVAVIVSAIMMFKVSDEKKKAKEEIEKYKKLLADKMEVEAEGIRKLKDENEKLKEANKNLEVEIRVLSEKSDKRDSRTLQIVRRALEVETGKPVVTSQNAKDFQQLITDIVEDAAALSEHPVGKDDNTGE